MKPTTIDLFAGVGGLSLGFKTAGFDIVMANEYDSSIAEAYKKNHSGVEMLVADITKMSLQDTFGRCKHVDIIIGGPPCQGFSQKGQRKTIKDERNFLFLHYFKTVELIHPRYFVMENVPNLLTSEDAFFMKEIEGLFNSIGYTLNAGIFNTADYGVPQNRKRACIIGKLGATQVSLPTPFLRKVSAWDAISDLAFLESGEGTEIQEYRFTPQSDYQTKLREGSNLLYNHVATTHSSTAIQRMRMIQPECGKESLPVEHLTKSIYSGTWSRIVKDEPAVTITTRFDTPSSGRFMHPYLNRAITVREAARLQSFPDIFRFFGTKSSQMKQVGNAVPPLFAEAIAKAILADMNIE